MWNLYFNSNNKNILWFLESSLKKVINTARVGGKFLKEEEGLGGVGREREKKEPS